MKKSIGSSKIVVVKTNNEGEKPMLYLDDIKVEFESQGFKGTHIGISPDKDKSVLFLESVRSTQSIWFLIAEAVYIFMKTDKSNSKIFQYREVLHTYGTSLSIDINATVATKHLQKKYLSNIPEHG